MTLSAATKPLSLSLLCAALALPNVTRAAHEAVPGHESGSPAGSADGKGPTPSPVDCGAGVSPAERGKTTNPGSPGSQSGALPAAGVDPCEPMGAHHPAGKTTDPGSRGTQGGAKPSVPPGPTAPIVRDPR